jgi:hypothetical protein
MTECVEALRSSAAQGIVCSASRGEGHESCGSEKAWHAVVVRGSVVFKHPYFVVADKDGNFDLNDLPPGTYTIKAWHEKLGTPSQKVTVGASESKTLEFVFKAGS